MSRRRICVALLFAIAAVAVVGLSESERSSPAAQGQPEFRLLAPGLARDEPAVPTSTPTATLGPTLTPTVTPSPTPTVPVAPAGVFTRNVSSYFSSIGTLHIVGEVVNNTTNAVQFVEIAVRLYSQAGTLLDTDFTYSDVSVISAGRDSPFDILVIDPLPGIAGYELFIADYSSPSFDPPVSGLTAEVTNSFVSITGTRHDVGFVTNGSASRYEFVQVIIAYYNSEGTVIRVDFTYADPSDLNPGQVGSFEVLLLDAEDLPISSYRIWVDGDLP